MCMSRIQIRLRRADRQRMNAPGSTSSQTLDSERPVSPVLLWAEIKHRRTGLSVAFCKESAGNAISLPIPAVGFQSWRSPVKRPETKLAPLPEVSVDCSKAEPAKAAIIIAVAARMRPARTLPRTVELAMDVTSGFIVAMIWDVHRETYVRRCTHRKFRRPAKHLREADGQAGGLVRHDEYRFKDQNR